MRPLVLAALAIPLAGCNTLSVNYAGTSFKAMAKPPHVAEGEGREVMEHEGEPVAPVEVVETEDANGTSTPSDVIGRTPSVFPNTAQPAGRAPVREDREAKAEGEQRPHAEPPTDR